MYVSFLQKPITECCPSDLTDTIRQGTGHASIVRDDVLATYLGILNKITSGHLEDVNGKMSDHTMVKRKMTNTLISTKYYTEN
jgi:hypothetical protein